MFLCEELHEGLVTGKVSCGFWVTMILQEHSALNGKVHREQLRAKVKVV